MNVRLLLADDHNVVRQGLKALLANEPEFELVGEAADGRSLLQQVDEQAPDVLLLDIMMPGLNGLDVTRQVVRRHPKTRVCVLSMHANESYVIKALQNGALGYVLKSAQSADLVRGLKEVAAGRRYLSPPLTDRAIDAYLQRFKSEEFDLYETLTDREREVMQLLVEGLKNIEVAERLCISPRTVESHRAQIMRKLGLKNRTELIRFAIQRGIVSPGD